MQGQDRGAALSATGRSGTGTVRPCTRLGQHRRAGLRGGRRLPPCHWSLAAEGSGPVLALSMHQTRCRQVYTLVPLGAMDFLGLVWWAQRAMIAYQQSSVMWAPKRRAIGQHPALWALPSYAVSSRSSTTATGSQRAALPAVSHHSPSLRGLGGLRAPRCQPCTPSNSQSQAATSFKTTNIGGYRGLHTPVSGSQARVVIPTAHSTIPTYAPSRASQDGSCA